MFKLIRKGSTVIAILGKGNTVKRKNVSKEEYAKIKACETQEELLRLMIPDYGNAVAKAEKAKETINAAENSNILRLTNNSVYWDEVSPLSLPQDLVERIVDAEQAKDEVLIQTYRNFWTLLSLNPDEECRKNLFWFLQKTGITISRSGFFVAYRNVVQTDEVDEFGDPIYTDEYTHSFKIIMGRPVTMDRDKTNRDSKVTCSRGLHLGASWWLTKGYFGNVGIVCLCNPAKVVAVPHLDQYGKLRTCEYIPIDFAHFDQNDKVIPYDVADGFECKYAQNAIYEGLLGSEESVYTLDIPEIPGVNIETIRANLLDIARDRIAKRVLI